MQMLLFPRRMRYLWSRSVWWILLTGVRAMTNYAVGGVYKASESLMHEVSNLQRRLDLANQIQMEIELLREQNKRLKEALEFYASGQHIDSISIGSSYSIRIEDGTKAKEAIKDCE